MQTIRIEILQVLESIYAQSALATLAEIAKCPLFHPDHTEALRLTVRDAIGVLLAANPTVNISLTDFSDERATFSIDSSLNPLTATEILRAAITRTTLHIILRAASLPAPDLPTLTALLPRPTIAIARPYQ